jgi:hypothetical protein
MEMFTVIQVRTERMTMKNMAFLEVFCLNATIKTAIRVNRIKN